MLPQSVQIRLIATGILADEVKVDKCKEVGDKVVHLVHKNVHDHSFRKKDQVVTLACNTAVLLMKATSRWIHSCCFRY